MLQKKLSIPATVGRVLEYIPKLQKEVDDLTHKKDVLSSKLSALEGNIGEFIQDEKPKNSIIKEKISSCTISANKLGDKELVIQVSAFEKVSISEVLLLLEKNGYAVIDISCFQSFGGTTFYNLHLWVRFFILFNMNMIFLLLHCQLIAPNQQNTHTCNIVNCGLVLR